MKAYQCKVSLKDSSPAVWWRVCLPAGISFSALSLLLEELTGKKLGDGFLFEIHRDSRVWEPSASRPLAEDYYYSAYSAAHTPLSSLFEKERTLYARGADTALRIEPETQEENYPFSYPLLLKTRGDPDAQTLQERLKARFVLREETGAALGRAELLASEENGTLTLHSVEPELSCGEGYRPSASSVLADTAAMLRKLIENPPDPDLRMKSLLLRRSGEELQRIAKKHGLSDTESKEPEALADELCALLLTKEALQDTIQLMTDEEVVAFEAIAGEGAPHPLTEEEEDLFDTLIADNYVFIDKGWTTVTIPAELPALYRAAKTPELDKKRRQLNWIVDCMNDIIPPYYARLPLNKFYRLCRRSSDPELLPEEVPALLRELPEDYTECVVTEDEILSWDLANDPNTREKVIAIQGDKPWRIMRENEISELLTYGYPPRDPSCCSLRAYLQKHFRLDSEELDSILHMVHTQSAYCHKMKDLLGVLDSFRLKPTRKQTEELTELIRDVVDNTPTFYYRGFAPVQVLDEI